MNDLKNILPEKCQNLWNAYQYNVDRGLKSDTSNSLSLFINEMLLQDAIVIEKFVVMLTDLKRTNDFKVDYRILDNIILPNLILGITSNKLTSNRRLAQFADTLFLSKPLFKKINKELNYNKEYFESYDFYKKEIELNRSDEIALNGILERIKSGIDYATHDLPKGLHWSIEGIEESLNEFGQYSDLISDNKKWKTILKDWNKKVTDWKKLGINSPNSFYPENKNCP